MNFVRLILWLYCLPLVAQYSDTGMASYYADKFEGNKTSNGEVYDHNKYTCAHRTLPFGTKLKVTLIKTNKSVIVRVNDRGPFKRNRIIDLSKKAASKIGLIQYGHGEVRVEQMSINETFDQEDSEDDSVLSASSLPTQPATQANPVFGDGLTMVKLNMEEKKVKGWGIQIGSFKTFKGLLDFTSSIAKKYQDKIYIKYIETETSDFFRVYIAPYSSRNEGLQVFNDLKNTYESPILTELD